MPDQGSGAALPDSNFVETIRLLNANQVKYWVCHGTLLGLTRDGALIPWDHDIDIAAWPEDLPKQSLIELMSGAGYKLKSDGADYDFVAFVKGDGREVDFNFYRRAAGSPLAYSEWYIPRSRVSTLLEIIAERRPGRGRWRWLIDRLFVFSPLARLLVRGLKVTGLLYRSAGYTTPAALLDEFEFVHVAGLDVRMPRSREEILGFLYGSNWRVPKRSYDWTTESPATRISDARF